MYSQFELRSFGGLHVAAPKRTPWYAGYSVAGITCQISAGSWAGPDGDLGDQARVR